MSNRFSGNMIVIDTTDTQIGGLTPDIGPKGTLLIKAIVWVATAAKDIADGDKITIENQQDGGDIIIACDAQLAAVTGSTPYKIVFGGDPWSASGLYIEDLDGGELQFFLA